MLAIVPRAIERSELMSRVLRNDMVCHRGEMDYFSKSWSPATAWTKYRRLRRNPMTELLISFTSIRVAPVAYLGDGVHMV
jgi:hypothetical protein